MAAVTNSTGLSLDPSAFLNLFITQLEHQDPTSPMDPSQMTTVLAQLTTVQDLANLQTTFQQSLAEGMIGEQVTYTTPSSTAPLTGTVAAAEIQNGVVGVAISGSFVPLSAITEIQPPPPANSTTGNSTASASGT